MEDRVYFIVLRMSLVILENKNLRRKAMSKVDFIIVITYMLGMVLIGYRLGKKNETQEDYFLAGRSMPWLPVGLSVAATMVSANGFVGGPGWAYNSGIGPFMVNITVPLAIMAALYTTIPVFYNLKLTSVYEYSEKRLGTISRTLTVMGFLMNSLIQVSSMVYIPALIVNRFTDFNIEISVTIIVVIAIIYTLLGGIKAVIWTDATQMIILWGGLLFAFTQIFRVTGLSLGDTYNMAREAGKLEAIDFTFNLTSTNGFWASLVGGFIMWVRYFGVDQGQVQRILTSKSYRGVKNSFMVSAVIMNILYFLFMALGVILFIYYDGIEFDTSNGIMIDFIANHLPVGVVGLLISGIFAAAMSSIDSLLNSMTTVYTKDIHERFFSKSHRITSLKGSMMISTVFGVLIIIFSLIGFSGSMKSVLDVIGSYISYLSGPMCGAFFLAMFTVRSNDRGVASGIILGMILTLILSRNISYSWIWNPFVGFVFTSIIGYLGSFIFKSEKTMEENYRYTLMGQRRELLERGEVTEEGVSKLPLALDRYSVLLLIFFLSQYIILYIMGLC